MGDSSQYSFALSEDAVLDFWRAVDLEAWKSEMDAQGVTVASNQETSASNRKRLAEATREFKALPATEEKMRSFGQLLRSYQVGHTSQESLYKEALRVSEMELG